jgi:hypothetical protein
MSERPKTLLACVLAALVLVATGGGCQKPLFPEGTPRTQFDAHDRMRNQEVPLEEPDVFGNPQPALRARLGRR